MARNPKDEPPEDHQPCPKDEHALPADAISHGGDPQGERSIPDERQREHQTDLPVAEPELGEIQRKHHGDEAIRKEPHHP